MEQEEVECAAVAAPLITTEDKKNDDIIMNLGNTEEVLRVPRAPETPESNQQHHDESIASVAVAIDLSDLDCWSSSCKISCKTEEQIFVFYTNLLALMEKQYIAHNIPFGLENVDELLEGMDPQLRQCLDSAVTKGFCRRQYRVRDQVSVLFFFVLYL